VCDALEAHLADVGEVGCERHRFEVHRAHAIVRSKDGTKETSAQVEAHGVGLDGEVHGLVGEVAEDDQDGCGGRDGLGLADDDEDILVVAIDGEVFAGVDG